MYYYFAASIRDRIIRHCIKHVISKKMKERKHLVKDTCHKTWQSLSKFKTQFSRWFLRYYDHSRGARERCMFESHTVTHLLSFLNRRNSNNLNQKEHNYKHFKRGIHTSQLVQINVFVMSSMVNEHNAISANKFKTVWK